MTIDFEGQAVRAFAGEPVAVVLFAAGVRTLARSPKYHRPRGFFCLENHCASCFLRIDGRPNRRSCMVPAREGLRWHLDYLKAVQSGVKDALARGLSQEQTVAELKMPEFRGYQLFDWVHPALNVPAAYKDQTAKP